jgi:site-specific recombinase XerD
MNELPTPNTEIISMGVADQLLPVLTDRVLAYLESARARNTIRGYRSSFQQFQRWCYQAGLTCMPATDETIALYLSSQAASLRPSTLEHHLAAISKAHKAAGFPSPIPDSVLVFETLKGIKRTHGTAPKQKAPVLAEDLRLMLRLTPDNVQGIRDRAILLVGFAGAFRRSELVALDVIDLKFQPEGLLVTLRRSKQIRKEKVVLLRCPGDCTLKRAQFGLLTHGCKSLRSPTVRSFVRYAKEVQSG